MTQIAGILRLNRLGEEIIRHAQSMVPTHTWGHQPNASDFSLLAHSWADRCQTIGRNLVTALPGTRLQHVTPACLVLQIEACDAIGAAALAERQMKVRISLLMDPPQEDQASCSSTRIEMLHNSAIRKNIIKGTEKDDGQSSSFIKALLSIPSYATPATSSGAGTTAQAGSSVQATSSSSLKYFISVSLFKEKIRNRKITKMSAGSSKMIHALRLLVSKGFIKALHRHRTSPHATSNM